MKPHRRTPEQVVPQAPRRRNGLLNEGKDLIEGLRTPHRPPSPLATWAIGPESRTSRTARLLGHRGGVGARQRPWNPRPRRVGRCR